MSNLEFAAATAAQCARPQSRCFVCGPDHPRGLRLKFDASPGAVSAEWTPSPDWEGFAGIVHGGIVGTVLDEAMSKAVAALPCEALTAELRVRFRRQVAPGERMLIRGWVNSRQKRLMEAEASLTASDGTERAHAWASFVLLRTGMPATHRPSRPESDKENQ